MATLRALRLLQSIESKNINSAQLDALLAENASRQTDLPLIFGHRAATERILAPETFPTILGSSAATTGLANSTLAMTKIAASLSAMGMVANSATASNILATTAVSADLTLANRAIYAATIGKAPVAIQAPWAKAWKFRGIYIPVAYTAIASDTGRLISVNGTNAYRSDDGGTTWTSISTTAPSVSNIRYAGGHFFYLSYGTAYSYLPSSGVGGITTVSSALSSLNWSLVAKTSAGFIFVGLNDAGACAQLSSPGGTVYPQTLPAVSVWNDLVASSTTFLLFGNGGTAINTAYTSASGYTGSWTTRTLPSSQAWNSAAAGSGPDDGKFMLVANSTVGAFSGNHGATWSAITLPSGSNWGRVVYHAGSRSWIAFSSNTSVVATSINDGVTWSTRAAPAANIGQGSGGGYGSGGPYVLGAQYSTAYLNF